MIIVSISHNQHKSALTVLPYKCIWTRPPIPPRPQLLQPRPHRLPRAIVLKWCCGFHPSLSLLCGSHIIWNKLEVHVMDTGPARSSPPSRHLRLLRFSSEVLGPPCVLQTCLPAAFHVLPQTLSSCSALCSGPRDRRPCALGPRARAFRLEPRDRGQRIRRRRGESAEFVPSGRRLQLSAPGRSVVYGVQSSDRPS